MLEQLTIFIDESGCLGNNKRSSNIFLATALVCRGRCIADGIKRAGYRTLKNKQKNKRGVAAELKGMSTTLAVKKYFFRLLPQDGWSLLSVILDKNTTLSDLQTKSAKEKMYNLVAQHLILQIKFPQGLKTVHLVFDKCKSAEEIRRFNSGIEKQLTALLPVGVKLYISHESSYANLGLQAVDLFSWGIYRKFDRNDLEWFDIFRHRMESEKIYSVKSKTAPLASIS